MSKQTHMHIGAHIYTDLLSSVRPWVAIISCSKMFTSLNETEKRGTGVQCCQTQQTAVQQRHSLMSATLTFLSSAHFINLVNFN